MNQLKMSIALVCAMCLSGTVFSQVANWGSLNKNQRHIVHLYAGLDYSLVFGGGYGYQFKSRIPIVIGAEYSFPSGDNVFDDFKTKIGGQMRLFQIGNIQVSTKMYGIFRRFENEFAALKNFGCDLSGTVGYYRSKWHFAGEIGFDKAIVTHFDHSKAYKEIYPLVQDGWYEPATGGNYYYGVQTGFSFKKTDVYVKAGKTITQDFKTTALFPFYAQLGIVQKL
jgi:hypothetical protein